MIAVQSALDVDEIKRIINKVMPTVENEDHQLVVAALLTMVVIALYPQLEGDELITAVEDAAKMLVTMMPANKLAS